MNTELRDMMLTYLGEIMQEHETTFDWFEKDKIGDKINAVNVLLESNCRVKSWYEKVAEGLHDLKEKK